MKKKSVVIVSIALFIFAIIGVSIYQLNQDGYLYIGGWEKTPESALKTAAQNAMPMEENALTVKVHLDTYYLSDHAVVFYVSKNDILCVATIVKNEKEEWHYRGHSEEGDIADPCYFVLNGEKDQELLFPFHFDKKSKKVYGWKYTNGKDVLINGKSTGKKTYTAELSDQRWKIDYWWCDDVEESSEDAIVLQFAHSLE